MAGAPKGNKNNEQWTLEEAELLCNKILDYIQQNKDCYTIGEACLACGEYEDVVKYLHKKFNIEFPAIKKGREIIKNRIISFSLQNKLSTAMSIFILVNNHGMENAQSIKQENTGNVNINVNRKIV